MTAPYRPRWTDDAALPPAPPGDGRPASQGPGVPRWAIVAALAVGAVLFGVGVFVLAVSVTAGADAEAARSAATEARSLLIEVRDAQNEGRERTYRTQATLCELQSVLGVEPAERIDDPCTTEEVRSRIDPTSADQGQQRLACLIAVAATGAAPDRCASVLADLDPVPGG